MKKILLAVAVLSFAVIGCGPKHTVINAGQLNACLKDAPAWVLAGGAEGGLSAVGSAKLSNAGLNFTRSEALANGRDELARVMQVKVENMFKNFTQTTGIGDKETVDKVVSNVSRQIASQTISGSKQAEVWVSECNELFVLVVADAPAIEKEIKAQAVSSYRNEQALWQQIQAKNALKEMDEAIKSTMNTPNNQLEGYQNNTNR